MKKYSSYTIERIKCNPLIKGFLLLLETILWYIWRENLYIICEVNETRTKIKEVKLTQEEKMEEFSQFKYVYATDTPNKYVVINSNKDMLYNLGVDKGIVLIKLGKAYRSIFSHRSKKDIQDSIVRYWINQLKVQDNIDKIEKLKGKTLSEYNELYCNRYIERLF